MPKLKVKCIVCEKPIEIEVPESEDPLSISFESFSRDDTPIIHEVYTCSQKCLDESINNLKGNFGLKECETPAIDIWYEKHPEFIIKHRGEYIAFDQDANEVIAFGQNYSDVISRAKNQRPNARLFIDSIPDFDKEDESR